MARNTAEGDRLMAHSAMHFGLGAVAGAVAGLPLLRGALRKDTAKHAAIWILTSYGVGALAVIPSLLSFLGVPEGATSYWTMNVFVLHPLIDQLKSGGKLIGEVLIVSCFFFQYVIMMFLLWRTRRN